MIKTFKRLVNSLSDTVSRVKNESVELNPESGVGNFENSKGNYYYNLIVGTIKKLQSMELKPIDMDEVELISKIIEETKKLDHSSLEILEERCNKLAELLSQVKEPPEEMTYKIPKLPDAIHDEIVADLKEIKRCFESGSYRGCTILCGRVLETMLHRKYYESTSKDILETNPSIGLGTLIAKLRERGVYIEPGLNEQIHLVNQVRINSVHKKKQVFVPSKDQSYAIILFTLDILKKMF